MRPELNIKIENRLVLAPHIKQAIELLQLSTLDLEKKIQDEIMKNPFLEEEAALSKDKEKYSNIEQKIDEREKNEEILKYFDDSSDVGTYYTSKEKESNRQKFFEGALNKSESLEEHLIWQLRLETDDEKDFSIGEMIISNINDDGYFKGEINEIIKLFNTTLKRTEKVLKLIQTFEPFGVGARDVQECLLIQLKYHPKKDPWAERIVKHYFKLLEKHKFKEIAGRLGISITAVKKSFEFIQQLSPNPGLQYTTGEIKYVVPDVILERIKNEYNIALNDQRIPRIRINSYYYNLLQSGNGKKDLKEYLKEKYGSAILFIKSIEQRLRTLYRTSESIIFTQKDFFDKGPKYLIPLTLREIANMINMHESTISRVTNEKYLQCQWGIFELKYFFSSKVSSYIGEDLSSRSVKEFIKDIIENEAKIYTDKEITEILTKSGIKISRRTITKYRKQMKIFSSYMRNKR